MESSESINYNQYLHNKQVIAWAALIVIILINSYHILILLLSMDHFFITEFSKTYWILQEFLLNIFYKPIYSTPLLLIQLVFEGIGFALCYNLFTRNSKKNLGIVFSIFLFLGTFVLLLIFLIVNMSGAIVPN